MYRIHAHDETLDSLLDSARPDGWVASDEDYDTQPQGISCCADIEALLDYTDAYSMNVQDGDRLVALSGRPSLDDDRDNGAERLIVASYEVVLTIESGRAWRELAGLREREDCLDGTIDAEEMADDLYLDDDVISLVAALRRLM